MHLLLVRRSPLLKHNEHIIRTALKYLSDAGLGHIRRNLYRERSITLYDNMHGLSSVAPPDRDFVVTPFH